MAASQLDIFYKDLPYKPYCADYLDRGLSIYPKNQAIGRRYIQGNQPCLVNYLFFDLDHEDSVLAWQIGNLPEPYWTAKNRKNGHCHICYKLETPFPTTEISSIKPIRYASAIQAAYAKTLGSDTSYSRLITKNPLHPDWDVTFWSDRAYSLDYLADFVDLDDKPTPEASLQGLGRNCTVFDSVRHWGYREVLPYLKQKSSYEAWFNAVLQRVLKENENFPQPLQYSELKQIAKSVAKWIWARFSLEDFSEIQAKRGAKGGEKSKRKPVANSEATTQPWKKLGISQSTYYRRKKVGKI